MSEEGQAYSVEYLDDSGEETNWLKRPGVVKITYPNFDTFEGSIDTEKRKQGQGKYTWNEKNEEDEEVREIASFEGLYVDGVKTGLGKMMFPNGDSYHGLWGNNCMHGEGTYIYANGDIFSGTFEKGIKHGEGTYEYASDKSQLIGKWENGFITEGSWKFADGSRYSGRFDKGMPIGNGVFVFTNGFEQQGEYVKSDAAESGSVPTYTWKGSQIMRSASLGLPA